MILIHFDNIQFGSLIKQFLYFFSPRHFYHAVIYIFRLKKKSLSFFFLILDYFILGVALDLRVLFPYFPAFFSSYEDSRRDIVVSDGAPLLVG